MKLGRIFVLGMLLVAVALMVSGTAQAATLDDTVSKANFWIGDSEGNPIVGNYNVGLGQTFTVSVWMQTTQFKDTTGADLKMSPLDVFFGFSTTVGNGSTKAAADTALGLINGVTAGGTVAAANLAAYGITPGAALSAFGGNYWYLGGGATKVGGTATDVRPWGIRLNASQLGGVALPLTATKLFDVTLKNNSATTINPAYLTLWNPGGVTGSAGVTSWGTDAGASTTTWYVRDNDANDPYNPAYGAGTGYAVKVVPEPSAFLALGSGLLGMAGYVIRRRK